MGNPIGLVFIINGLKSFQVVFNLFCFGLFMRKEKAPFQSQFFTLWPDC